ncbi:AraC family transcriptional regulator [Bacteroidota bacterium]
MNELLETMDLSPNESFYVSIFQDHIYKSAWRYHLEYELTLITEGSGKRIVGDSIADFYPGDLIFIGPRIPHVLLPEKPVMEQISGRRIVAVYILFSHDILPQRLLSLPEFDHINTALKLSERGIKISGNSLNEVSRIMLELPYLDSIRRLTHFYEIMDYIGKCDSYSYLVSEDYIKNKFETTNDRISEIHKFLMNNYHNKIHLEEIAEIAHMAPASVCRFFKSFTGLTIFEYLNKIKIEYSCQLLLSTNQKIIDISYDCGFNNLSHFNKQFKKFNGLTPTEFRDLRDKS